MGKKIPLPIPPGVVLNLTGLEAQGRWIDCDKIRFDEAGQPEKIGGWEQWQEDGDELEGVCRSIFCWMDSSYNVWHAFGTEGAVYIFDQNKERTINTPLGPAGTLGNNPFSTELGSDLVEVEHTDHGRVVGESATFDDATSVGGLDMNGTWLIVEINDPGMYTVEHTSNASSSAIGGGASVTYQYPLSAGDANMVEGGGWGIGTWGSGTWGTLRESNTYLQFPRHWSFDKYGQYLLAMPTGGKLYDWQLDAQEPLAEVSGAPTGSFMFVTSERMVCILGAGGDPMRVRTSDDDDYTEWTPAEDNTCIDRNLQKGNRMIAGAVLSQGNNVLWSDTHLYRMTFNGTNTVYSTPDVAAIGIVGPTAFVVVDGVAFWMAPTGFYLYNGSVEPIPNWDTIQPIFDNLSELQRVKTVCWYNAKHREIWWHYAEEGFDEPNRYIMVDLATWAWSVGELNDRTAMFPFSLNGVTTIFGADSSGNIWNHEIGLNADGAALDWYIENGYLDMAEGEMGVDVDGYVPDFERWAGSITITMTLKDLPESASVLDQVEFTLDQGEPIEDMRLHGRLVKFRFGQVGVIDGDWALGAHKLEIAGIGIPREG